MVIDTRDIQTGVVCHGCRRPMASAATALGIPVECYQCQRLRLASGGVEHHHRVRCCFCGACQVLGQPHEEQMHRETLVLTCEVCAADFNVEQRPDRVVYTSGPLLGERRH